MRDTSFREIERFRLLIERELLPNIDLIVNCPHDPIKVINRSLTWKTIGTGNYAAVFVHYERPDWVVKVYGRNHAEIKKEIEVYKKMGKHEAYSTLYAYGDHYLVLKRLRGITLFNAAIEGVPIHESVMEDVENAINYAKSVGLNPYDVHGKNIVMNENKGYIVDISDFYKKGYCSKWHDLKKAYDKIYLTFLYRYHPPIPLFVMEAVRKGYRLYKRYKSILKSLKMKSKNIS